MSQTTTRPLTTRVMIVLISLLAPTTLAQTAEEILDASRAAIAEIDGFMAQFRMKGEGGSMFAETMPSMSGQVFFGTHDEFGRVIHTIGESKDKQKDPPPARQGGAKKLGDGVIPPSSAVVEPPGLQDGGSARPEPTSGNKPLGPKR